jgi:hypothetical protein
MAKQTINVGTSPNDNTGDALRDAMIKVNDNTDELYDLHQLKMGWFDYSDLATATTPITITGGSGFIDLPNDELGAQTLKTHAPTGVTDVWDASGGSFDWGELTLGDTVDIRLSLELVTTTVNTDITVELFLGSAGPYTIPFITESNFKSSGTYQLLRFNSLYMGNTDTLNNGGVFKASANNTCTIKVIGWYCRIIRR